MQLDTGSSPTSPTSSILVVEDDPALRDALQAALEEEGFSVLVAGNGAEALEILARKDLPFLILLDMMMPVMDGREFQEEIAKAPRLAAIPVIILSAFVRSRVVADTGGVKFVLRKPIGLAELLAHIECYRVH